MTTPNTFAASRIVLESTPQRALVFLRAMGSQPALRAAMERVGYTDAEHEEGWHLLLKASGHRVVAAPLAPASTDEPIRELLASSAPVLLRARAALARKHPEQASFVFDGLPPARGPEGVIAIATFLERCEELERSAARKATRKGDHAALATLAERGITTAERARIQGLLDRLKTQRLASPPPDTTASTARFAALNALYVWLTDWRDTARSIFPRRGQLLRLGIGKRRMRKSAEPAQPPAAPEHPDVPPRAANEDEDEDEETDAGPPSRVA